MTDADRYADEAQRMRAAVECCFKAEGRECEIDQQVEINVATCGVLATIKLLISKGLLTKKEVDKVLADEMEAERDEWEFKFRRLP